MIWFCLFGLAIPVILFLLLFVEPDWSKYPDGLWPGREDGDREVGR